MQRIFKKDHVKVIYGSHKGKIGVVLKVLPKESKLIVEGINKVKKHKKIEGSENKVIEEEVPIHICKVALIDSKTKQKIKVGFDFDKNNKKIRVNRKTREEIPVKK